METEDYYYRTSARRERNTEIKREKSCTGGSKIPCWVGVSFAVLCIVQASLNVALRLNSGVCPDKCDFSVMSVEEITDLILLLDRDELLDIKFPLQNQIQGLREQFNASSPPYPDAVEIRSKRLTIPGFLGSSVKLSCEAPYYFELCDPLHVCWHLGEKGENELKDPRKYQTTVKDTRSDGGRRLRRVETEIFNLTSEDSGRYQCVAYCRGEKRTVGRVSEVDVRDWSSA